MPHMIAYLGGDSDTLAARRALTKDVRLAVEFPTERKMLVVCVMQTGEIILSWDDINPKHANHRTDQMYLVGQLVSDDNGMSHRLETELEGLDADPPKVSYINGKKMK